MTDIDKLLKIMRQLRDPEQGCPWDVQQSFSTIAPYTIEEAYEVQQAILQKDYPELCQELGDLLFQVVFHAQMASEANLFQFQDVVDAICEKMIRRHPHVFGAVRYESIEQQHQDWERIKREEKQTANTNDDGLLSGISSALPALKRAQQMTQKAASVGFDWDDSASVFEKCLEEVEELQQGIARDDADNIQEELGDVLFSLVNLARKLNIDAEYALQASNLKFENRFGYIEHTLQQQGKSLPEAELAEMEALWQAAKQQET